MTAGDRLTLGLAAIAVVTIVQCALVPAAVTAITAWYTGEFPQPLLPEPAGMEAEGRTSAQVTNKEHKK